MDDLISRDAAIDALYKIRDYAAYCVIRNVPSVDPVVLGKWISYDADFD